MRLLFVLPLVASMAATACNAEPTGSSQARNSAAPIQSQIVAEPVTLTASDGVTVRGLFYNAAHPKALILLFHQAESSKDEYATIAPRLAEAGYSALAIDQRAGGALFGTNETAAALGHKADHLEARPDLRAALDWAQTQKLPIILWGSSYSSSLIFPLAAGDPQGIVALLSFSPGEYFGDKLMIRSAAAKVKAPVFVASTRAEAGDADPIMAALPKSAANVRFIPEHGVHGSSTLIAARNPEGAEANWRAVMGFLDRATRAK
jgi:dienelactone hydrolase